MHNETPSIVLIGQNRRGQWVAQKLPGQCGGLFASHAAALKFALFENGQRPEAVIAVPGVFDLALNKPHPPRLGTPQCQLAPRDAHRTT